MRRLLFLIFVLTGSFAYAEEVTIKENYPALFARHKDVFVDSSISLVNPFDDVNAQQGITVYGNMTVTGAMRFNNNDNSVSLFAGCSESTGSDIFCSAKIDDKYYFGPTPRYTNTTYAPGLDSSFTVSPFFKTRDFFASTHEGLQYNAYAYLAARGTTNAGRSYIGSGKHNAAPPFNDPVAASTELIPMRIDGAPVIFSPFRPDADPLQIITIGKPSIPFFPQIEGFNLFVYGTGIVQTMEKPSSRAFKTDITPLSQTDYSDFLSKLQSTALFHYRFKDDASREEHMGVIAEDAPEEIVSEDKKGLDVANCIGFLAANVKELKTKNDALKARLEVLYEKKKRS